MIEVVVVESSLKDYKKLHENYWTSGLSLSAGKISTLYN